MFGVDEIIVSKTDTKGILTYVNEVFLRVSLYDEADVLGKPHNIIRHPDMPRAVFGLMWQTIQAGQEIFAYVLNLAADGEHYWVLAHVTPTFASNGRIIGFHSNRRLPERPAVAAVTSLYADLRAVERRHDRPADALAASTQRLGEVLADQGMDYDDWVWSLTGPLSTGARALAGAR